jgi:hypothetical protein
MLADLLDARCEDDAFWLLSVLLRTETIITKGMNFAFEAAKYEGKATDSISEFDLEYDLRFENQIAEHNVKKLVEDVVAPRMQIVGARLLNFLTTKFMEVQSVYKRGKVSSLGSQYRRPAIEAHEQNFKNDPVMTCLDLVRECWETLLQVDKQQAEAVYRYWLLLDDELIERLRIHALRKLIEAT